MVADIFTQPSPPPRHLKKSFLRPYIYIYKNDVLQKNVEFEVSKLQTRFLKDSTLFSRNTFSVQIVICLS